MMKHSEVLLFINSAAAKGHGAYITGNRSLPWKAQSRNENRKSGVCCTAVPRNEGARQVRSIPLPSNASVESVFEPGDVYLVGTGPGDPRLLTLGALDILQRAEVVLYDRLVGEDILSFLNPEAELVGVGKGRGVGTGSQESIQQQLAFHAFQGKRVVRLKGGDPCIFGRVGNELEFLNAKGVTTSVIPGITSASGIASGLGFPLTHNGIADGVCLFTGHAEIPVVAESLSAFTLVIYMGLRELPHLLGSLRQNSMWEKVGAVAVQSGTTIGQKVVWGHVDSLAERVETAGLRSPTLVIIGDVVQIAKDWPFPKTIDLKGIE